MELGFCKQNGGPLESSYKWEVWGKRKGVVFLGSEGRAWCWILESHKEGLGSRE